jgi:hypothetical protein
LRSSNVNRPSNGPTRISARSDVGVAVRPARLGTYVRDAPPYPVVRARLDRAIATRDLAGVHAAARALPHVVTLADVVEVLILMLEADDPAFESAVRRLVRFASESNGVTPARPTPRSRHSTRFRHQMHGRL